MTDSATEPSSSSRGTADPAGGAPPAAAVLRTLAYGDVFEFPLTAAETHRYLFDAEMSRAEVERTLDALVEAGVVATAHGLYALAAGAAGIVRRRERNVAAGRALASALRWGARIARLPFVRMVALTGALAPGNCDGGDFDYFVVTAAGRLWLCRALIIQLVVRPARLAGEVVCPNYLISEDRLALADRSPFAARELAQMIPLSGRTVYDSLREENRWVDEILPNAAGAPPATPPAGPRAADGLRRWLEAPLAGRVGDRLERFEMRRKVRELERRHGAGHAEVELSAQCCKGHFGGHGGRILSAWRRRTAALGLAGGAEAQESGT